MTFQAPGLVCLLYRSIISLFNSGVRIFQLLEHMVASCSTHKSVLVKALKSNQDNL